MKVPGGGAGLPTVVALATLGVARTAVADSPPTVVIGGRITFRDAVREARSEEVERLRWGHIVIEIRNGWNGFLGQPQVFTVKDEVRKAMRVLVTRPGIYDLGSIRVTRSGGSWKNYNKYDVERVADDSSERRAVLRAAIAGTTWERLASASPTQ